ncbi:MAG: hypothetical protein A6F72_02675 [Cycloclasticus sp. symbiont of Poecilosclerida sp. N]|nr:MAG: hypothetical protein A6F72_02675 [Cycloclasticus sp. symbiont of Poecilosclerida sp. N]
MQGFKTRVQQAEKTLCNIDPALKLIIQSGPKFDVTPFNKQPFEALVHAIIAQQLSVKSASAIRQRVHDLLPDVEFNEHAFKQITADEYKTAGLSQAKTNTVQGLIEFALDDANNFRQLQSYSDKEVKERLCQLKGIGPWTVDIFLMFGLKRLDIFASGDLGLRKAIKALHAFKDLPSPADCNVIAKKWHPYRTVAAWHLWRTVD